MNAAIDDTTDPRVLASEVDGLRRYEPEFLATDSGKMIWTQECAELIEGRWEGFITTRPWPRVS